MPTEGTSPVGIPLEWCSKEGEAAKVKGKKADGHGAPLLAGLCYLCQRVVRFVEQCDESPGPACYRFRCSFFRHFFESNFTMCSFGTLYRWTIEKEFFELVSFIEPWTPYRYLIEGIQERTSLPLSITTATKTK